VLATVLFTDMVDSTRRASELGDRGWRELLERHDQLTRTTIDRFQGRVVKHTGDGHCQVEQSDLDLRRCVLVNPQVIYDA
jgi:class 3 adenylate cyclase